MFNLCSVLFFSTIFVIVSSVFLSDEVKIIKFLKRNDENNVFEFDYKLDDGHDFHGKAYELAPDDYYNRKFVMMGSNRTFFWVDLTADERKNTKLFSKNVRLVELQNEDTKLAHFRDENFDYSIDKDGNISGYRYGTWWDTMNVCFKRANKQENSFHFIILSENNSKQHGGTIKIDNNTNSTMIGIPWSGVYRVNFTNKELNSLSFCKKIDIEIYATTPYIAVPDARINTIILGLLIG